MKDLFSGESNMKNFLHSIDQQRIPHLLILGPLLYCFYISNNLISIPKLLSDNTTLVFFNTKLVFEGKNKTLNSKLNIVF